MLGLAGWFAVALCLLLDCSTASATPSKRIVLLHSFGTDFKPFSDYAQGIRAELKRQSPWPVDIFDHSLVSARSGEENSEQPFVEYLRALYAKRGIDLIISIGAPAASFVQRHRGELFADVPMVFTAVEQRRVDYAALSENDAVVAVWIDYLAAFEHILRLLPDTKNIIVVVGTSPIERFWTEEVSRLVQPLSGRVAFSWTNNLSFEDILKHAANLPPHSALFWELMLVDAAGVVHEGNTALARLHAVANAPIFSYDDSFFGDALLGGPLHSALESCRHTAAVAVRILGGEKAGDIKIPPVLFSAPKYDWREMQRWGISERRLPPGSTILFRAPTIWERHLWSMIAIFVAIMLQAGLIGWLVWEHRRRNLAELQSRNAMADLTRANRMATAGELSASIAHEINQPLAGISASAGAARRWLRAEAPNLERAMAALDQVVAASHRAGDIITSVRTMFKNDSAVMAPIDLNHLILTVLAILRAELLKDGIELETPLGEIPPVQGDAVQLQQVILNLVMNAIEAMRAVPRRALTVRSEKRESDRVRVSIEDTGHGVDPSHLDRIFDRLFTTKASGMGMGLSICRSIIENHHGRIWVSSAKDGGSIFQFELPVSVSRATAVDQPQLGTVG